MGIAVHTEQESSQAETIASESQLVRLAWSLIASGSLAEISSSEASLVKSAGSGPHAVSSADLRDSIRNGEDPLRRPPAFVRNAASVRHINVAHGIYPRQPLDSTVLDNLAASLRKTATTSRGRTYAGGLTKFEPKEMERLPIPDLPVLMESA